MKTALCFLASLAFCATIITGVRYAAADDPPHSVSIARAGETVIAQADITAPTDAAAPATEPAAVGSGSAVAPASTSPTSAPAIAEPQVEDISLLTKLWKGGQFFLFGIMALYIGLFAWAKLDKKHAFYAATILGAVTLLVASIRAGDTPTIGQALNAAGAALAILIKGPGKA